MRYTVSERIQTRRFGPRFGYRRRHRYREQLRQQRLQREAAERHTQAAVAAPRPPMAPPDAFWAAERERAARMVEQHAGFFTGPARDGLLGLANRIRHDA